MNALELIHISKSFGTLQVLKDIRVKVNPGQFVSLIGPSGCGKSTLLRLIAGVENQSDGEIAIFEKRVVDRKGTSGYMPQKPLLLPWRNVLENVLLGADIQGAARSGSLKKAQQLLREFGLGDFMASHPRILSGGMAQKVALLRTILYNNNLLLLDEPFGALDALTRQSLQLWLLKLWDKHRATVLFVTHDIREAILLSDRILVMSERPGRIIADIPVDIQRPRKREHLAQKKNVQIEQRLFHLLMNEN
ncbi:MAG: ABC transporter ATP-binding protein [bacterium]|nr:ABC transporter ATP-binding protein [bacterium]